MDTPGHWTRRWMIAGAGALLQLCLGTVYAWSYFQKPLVAGYGWSNAEVAGIFSLAIFFLGIAAAWGGINLARLGPRRLAMIGGFLFAAGHLVAALALQIKSLPLLYLGYGVLGGTGLGLGYVTPVATAAQWFPDLKGLVTGMVIMGFGFGALLLSKILAPMLFLAMHENLAGVFLCLGVVFLPVTLLLGWILQNPPEGYAPPGRHEDMDSRSNRMDNAPLSGMPPTLISARFFLMWGMFFCNIVAGIAIISFQSPLLQDLLKQADSMAASAHLASRGATLIAVSSLFNGFGRLLWGGISDRMGRLQTFRILLASQLLAFLWLSRVSNPWLFMALVCYVLLCYGGGFGTMPSFVLDVFGSRRMPVVYGAILTAWSCAGLVGPQIVAWLKDYHPERAAGLAFQVGAGFLAAGFCFSLFLPGQSAFSARQKSLPNVE